MRTGNPIELDTVVIRDPAGEEIRWRTQRMVSLGADPELAATIARSRVDVHDIERLLKAGCPLELAWTISRPADESTVAVDGVVERVAADED